MSIQKLVLKALIPDFSSCFVITNSIRAAMTPKLWLILIVRSWEFTLSAKLLIWTYRKNTKIPVSPWEQRINRLKKSS